MPLLSASSAGMGVTKAQLAQVVRAIGKCPIIDNHAHPLLKPEALAKYPLMSITTEASGDAIHAASTGLSHIRGVKQLAHVLGCGQTWEAVVAAIEQRRIDDYEDWVSECLDGIATILVDDGLDAPDEVEDYSWHDSFTRSPCKRIVRIETIAGRIVHKHAMDFTAGDDPEGLMVRVFAEYDDAIREAIVDPEVVGFKSVICYRTGLDVPAGPDMAQATTSLKELALSYDRSAGIARLQHPGLNELVLHRAATLIGEMPERRKPIQFHTGLGDNDITLSKSSPAHLQEFIRAYPTVPIVLLHAGYPFTRELGYLATVYSNVYADIGEIFPFVSQDGQEKAVRQILTLVSGDVLCDYIRKGHISWKAAIQLTQGILFNNSNKLYHLQLDFAEWDTDNEDNIEADMDEMDLEIFTRFLRGKRAPEFIRIGWTDLTAMPRMRMVPFRKFITTLEEGNRSDIGITKASLGLLQHDWMTPEFSVSGEYRLHADFASLKTGPIPGHVSMYGDFREQDGSPVILCPRAQLQRAQEYGAQNGLSFIVGFEIEFVLLERDFAGEYKPIAHDGHFWSASRFFVDPQVPKLLADIVKALDTMEIHVEQLHAESAPGQFELVLPPLPPVAAVDMLLHTRDVVAALATTAGYKFTLYPKPSATACGTASHAHISISSPRGDHTAVYEPFYAGILKHLRAIAAFSYSNPASYERLVDGAWAGGRWVTWGTQNRETPLRKIEDSHWEIKCLDGLANPYLAMAAIIFAGARGVEAEEKLIWGDCEIDPALLSENDRKELNVTQMLPASVEEALQALKDDEVLTGLLGSELVEKYTAVKEFELKFLSDLPQDERKRWIMARY